MKQQTMHKFKWFWAWQDEAEETWLREMSQQGWHLFQLGLPAMYQFRKGEPEDYYYRLDFKSTPEKDLQEYLQLFSDAGWQYVGHMGGWQYFRKSVQTDEIPEIYTDPDSKIAKYKRILGFTIFFIPIMLMMFILLIVRINSPFLLALGIIYVILLTLLSYSAIKLMGRIKELQQMRI